MKPIRLVMEAFGSYGERETVDFTKPNQPLFLITGDTGAGKSTIFDAIVFALYGKASSTENEKKGELLRSQFAKLSVEPFVELTFSEGEERYTVKRIPAYRKLREKGEGKGTLKDKPETEKVTLTLPDGQEYPCAMDETNRKIEEIVGLTKAQFMQIAMIAQGEFMKILREESKQKKEIFRKLFHTEIFEKIVRELDRRKGEKGKTLERMRAECATIALGAAVPKTYENAARMEEWKRQITDGSLANIEPFLGDLATVCKQLAQEQDKSADSYRQAQEQRDKANEAYTRADEIVKYFTQLADAEAALQECARRDGEIRQKEALIRNIRAAYDIQTQFLRYSEAEKKAQETEAAMQQRKALLPALTTAAGEADALEQRAKAELETQQGSFHTIQERVAEAKKAFAKIKQAQAALQKSTTALEAAKQAEQTAQAALAEFQAQEAAWRERASELGNAEAAYEAWKAKNAELERVGEEIKNLQKRKKELSQCEKDMKQAQADFLSAARAYEEKNETYQLWNRRYMASKAKCFLDMLEDGKPCPICGAKDHPAPYQIAKEDEAAEISTQALETLKNEVEQLNQAQLKMTGQSNAAVTAWEAKQTAVSEILENLKRCESLKAQGSASGQEITDETIEGLFKRWKTAVSKEGKELECNKKERQELEKKLSDAAQQTQQLSETIAACHQKVEAANTEKSGNEREIKSLQGGLQYPSEQDAEKELRAAKTLHDEKKTAYDKAAKDAQNAAKAKTETETSIRQYEQELPVLIADTAQKQQAYEEIMREKKLLEPDWKSLVEQHRKDEPEQFQKEVQQYGEKKAAAKSLKDVAEKAVAGKERPDMEALGQAQALAHENCRKAQEAYDTIKTLCQDNQKVYDQLKPRNKECTAAASEFAKLERLYKLFSGTVTGGRMDLETYVQRTYLEQILHAANRRFQEMSAGQFELRMTDLDKAGEGKNKGLDLMVYSTVTGKTREIRTLSGGESFMAALALSLGMADQIQQNAAALNLDMMFIDEGFGSLDDHSRSQAVKVLKEMAGGARLVGIISHVTELKQEIDNQLLVTRDENGSHVRWECS